MDDGGYIKDISAALSGLAEILADANKQGYKFKNIKADIHIENDGNGILYLYVTVERSEDGLLETSQISVSEALGIDWEY